MSQFAATSIPTVLFDNYIRKNPAVASGVIEECRKRGVRIPEELSVVGFDDIPLSARLDPPLTTIRQDRTELGKSGFYTLHSLIHHIPISRTMLRPQLIVRKSTAPVRPER